MTASDDTGSIKNFEVFYEVKLLPYIHKLKVQRRLASFWFGITAILGCTFLPFFALVVGTQTETSTKLVFAGITILLLFCIHQCTKNKDAFEDGFKEIIIGQIINFIHPGLSYKSGISVSSVDYKNSCLFRNNYYNYGGDDLVSGVYKNVNFKCSELSVSELRRDYTDTIFHGLFFAARLNTDFSGGTYIWRNNNIQLPATIADEHYRMMPMPEVTRVDLLNGSFEKYYSVYTTDINEASAIVTNEMMDRIMNFREQVNRDITLSFVGGICYVALPFDEPLFEASAFSTANKEDVQEYFFTVLLILSIINQLKLYEF